MEGKEKSGKSSTSRRQKEIIFDRYKRDEERIHMNRFHYLMFDLYLTNLLSLRVIIIKHLINYLKKSLYMQSIILIRWSRLGENGRGIKKGLHFLIGIIKSDCYKKDTIFDML